jgi:hypothetical protein
MPEWPEMCYLYSIRALATYVLIMFFLMNSGTFEQDFRLNVNLHLVQTLCGTSTVVDVEIFQF